MSTQIATSRNSFGAPALLNSRYNLQKQKKDSYGFQNHEQPEFNLTKQLENELASVTATRSTETISVNFANAPQQQEGTSNSTSLRGPADFPLTSELTNNVSEDFEAGGLRYANLRHLQYA